MKSKKHLTLFETKIKMYVKVQYLKVKKHVSDKHTEHNLNFNQKKPQYRHSL